MPTAITNDFGQKLTKARAITTSRGYITIPRINNTPLHTTIPPTCVCAFNFDIGHRTTLKLPIVAPHALLPNSGDEAYNFALAIAWRFDNSFDVNRYILWNNGPSIGLYYPQYAGELIGSKFRVEVWDTIKGAPTEILTPAALDYFTSLFNIKTTVDEADTYSISTGTYVANMQSVDSGVVNQIDLPCIYTDAQVVPNE